MAAKNQRTGLDPKPGLEALREVLKETVRRELDSTGKAISDAMREKLDFCLKTGEEIAEIIGAEKAVVLRGLLEVLSQKNGDEAESLIRTLLEKFHALEKQVMDLAEAAVRKDDETPGLKKQLEEKSAKITELEAQLFKIKEELKEAKRAAKLAEIASSDIIEIRERLLEKLAEIGKEITAAIVAARDREKDGALAAYLEFKDIEEVDRACLEIFKKLNSSILGNIALYRETIEEYEAVSREITATDKIPSLAIYTKVAKCLAKMEALKVLQDQLISDQMDAAIEISPEWRDENGKLINFYEVMGVNQDATDDQIKSTYKEAATKCHPDRHDGNPDRNKEFQLLNIAYSILKDKDRRAKYDELYSSINN